LETNEQVAIKVIDKTRFSEQEDKIHREVDILHEISHPGVIKLHAMFDTPGKVVFKSKEGDFMGKFMFLVLFGYGEVTFGYA
jgi:serine/threonine protein kinase